MTAARRRTCWRIGMFLASMLVLVLARSGQAQSALPGAPQNLTGRALGTTVTFQWLAPTSGSPPNSYVVEAALAPGGAVVASLGVSETSLVVPGVPLGVYFVRVRGLNGAGRGAASNEVVVSVPGGGTGPSGCDSPPGAPQGLTARSDGNLVTLAWSAPTGGCSPTGYMVHAGSTTGLTNVAQVNVGALTALQAAAPSGVYYVRVVALNAFGASAPSTEVIVSVGSTPGACERIGTQWVINETATVTCDSEGPVTQSGTVPVTITQSGCQVRWTIAGVLREGVVTRTQLSASGEIALREPGVRYTENNIDIRGDISSDRSTIQARGHGTASGSFEGESGTCNVETTATMTRCWDVAVAVLQGWIIRLPGRPEIDPTEADIHLQTMADDAVAVDPARIVARQFPENPGQSGRALAWINELNQGCSRRPAVVLIGYSAGGHAVLGMSDPPQLCSRIVLDPFDPGVDFDQRSPVRTAPTGRPVTHFYATAPYFPPPFRGLYEMWGYRLSGPNVRSIAVTGANHVDLPATLSRGPLRGEVTSSVRQCLAERSASPR